MSRRYQRQVRRDNGGRGRGTPDGWHADSDRRGPNSCGARLRREKANGRKAVKSENRLHFSTARKRKNNWRFFPSIVRTDFFLILNNEPRLPTDLNRITDTVEGQQLVPNRQTYYFIYRRGNNLNFFLLQ